MKKPTSESLPGPGQTRSEPIADSPLERAIYLFVVCLMKEHLAERRKDKICPLVIPLLQTI